MASLNFSPKPRPCLVSVEKWHGLFYGIFQQSYIVPPSPLVGGHSGGVVSNPIALVENEYGELLVIDPTAMQIVFVDREIENYCFRSEKETDDETE